MPNWKCDLWSNCTRVAFNSSVECWDSKATYGMIKHSRRCKGRTEQRNASSPSPCSCSCGSECSLVWEDQSSFYMRRSRCKSRWVPAHWFQWSPFCTFLQIKFEGGWGQLEEGERGLRRDVPSCLRTEAGRFRSPQATSLACPGGVSHQQEARTTGVPQYSSHPPVISRNHSIKIHIWLPAVHCHKM